MGVKKKRPLAETTTLIVLIVGALSNAVTTEKFVMWKSPHFNFGRLLSLSLLIVCINKNFT